ncbi:MAG TPA: alpha/beta fold hydrolase [Pyrinomonadaceae bacterium]
MMPERNRKLLPVKLISPALFLLLFFSNINGFAQKMKAERGVAEVNGTRLAYEVKGKGTAIVLIHGGLADSRLWDDQFDAFAKHHRVLRYDLRGFGHSAPKLATFSHIEDLYALLKYLHIEKASLVGVSLGGMIAADFALEHPEMTNALVLTSSGLRGYQGPVNEKSVAAYRAAKEQGLEKAIELWLAHPFFASGRKNAAYERRTRAMLMDNFQAWGPDSTKIPWQWPGVPTIERLAEIKAPTLVVVGDHDAQTIQAIADILKDKIPGAEKVVITDVGHHLNMEKPKEYNRIVLDFLRER